MTIFRGRWELRISSFKGKITTCPKLTVILMWLGLSTNTKITSDFLFHPFLWYDYSIWLIVWLFRYNLYYLPANVVINVACCYSVGTPKAGRTDLKIVNDLTLNQIKFIKSQNSCRWNRAVQRNREWSLCRTSKEKGKFIIWEIIKKEEDETLMFLD